MSGISAYRGGPGIEQISRRDRLPESRLPDGDSAPPIDGYLEQKLPSVLFQPSLDQALVEALEPTVFDRTILQPERFQNLIDSTRDELSRWRESSEDDERRRMLQAADDVLSRTSELRDALALLRSLVQRA